MDSEREGTSLPLFLTTPIQAVSGGTRLGPYVGLLGATLSTWPSMMPRLKWARAKVQRRVMFRPSGGMAGSTHLLQDT